MIVKTGKLAAALVPASKFVPKRLPKPIKQLSIPQGLTKKQFLELSTIIRAKAKDMGLGDDIFVQGSRAKGSAKPGSDIDFGIRLKTEDFNIFLNEKSKLYPANKGSAKERTLLHAIKTGKIQSGEARLSALRKEIEELLNMEVDLSIIRSGGDFDNGIQLPLQKLK